MKRSRLLVGKKAIDEWARKSTRLSKFDKRLGSVRLPVVVVGGKQYTIDDRLSEFRYVSWNDGVPSIEFIPFASKKGMSIQYQLDKKK
jgi:hypothetical protein